MREQLRGFGRRIVHKESARVRQAKTPPFAAVLLVCAISVSTRIDAASATTPLPPPGKTRCDGQAYVSNNRAGTVAVIDTRTNTVTATIPVGKLPTNPTITPDRTQVYVSNVDDGTIAVIDVGTNAVVAVFTLGERPGGMAFTADGKHLLVTIFGEKLHEPSAGRMTPGGVRLTNAETPPDAPGGVRIITLATGEISPLIPLLIQPERVVITPDGRHAYVSNLRAAAISVIDIKRAAVIHTIKTPDLPYNFAMHPNGKKLYVGQSASNQISVIDTATNQIVDTFKASQGVNGIAFSPDYTRLYVTSVKANKLQYITLATGEVSAPAEAGQAPGFLRLTPDGRRGYIVHPYGNTVSVFDPATLAIANTITVGQAPTVIAVCGAP